MITLKTRVDKVVEDRVYETWFIGPDKDHLQNAGRIVYHVGEYQIIGAALLIGIEAVNKDYRRIELINEDDEFYKWADREEE
uniref:Uncharacterized protein n=1 Tax=viral metagenome TaxID=1070528 RepID=A0A6M3KYP1_9ZZZZ